MKQLTPIVEADAASEYDMTITKRMRRVTLITPMQSVGKVKAAMPTTKLTPILEDLRELRLSSERKRHSDDFDTVLHSRTVLEAEASATLGN